MKSKILITERSSKSRDPYVLYHDGLYYYCFSRDDKIYLSVCKDLDQLEIAEEIIVYNNKEGLKNIWAPELHIIDNKCYIYVAADNRNNENHRIHVLFNNSNNPLLEYEDKGIISDTSNKWAIDGTVLKYKNQLYFVWSGCDEDIHHKQELFIAKMVNPFELSGEKVLLSTPEYSWEKQGGDGINLAFVNEGPAVLYLGDKIYIVYSASGCWCEGYCLGMLKLLGDDPLAEGAWKKYNAPILASGGDIIGPGHCSFIAKNEGDNVERYMVFHSFVDRENLDLSNVNARYVKFGLKDDRILFS